MGMQRQWQGLQSPMRVQQIWSYIGGAALGLLALPPLAVAADGAERSITAWRKSQPVVVDGNLITSQGPGTALALGLELARLTAGADVASKVAQDMLVTVV